MTHNSPDGGPCNTHAQRVLATAAQAGDGQIDLIEVGMALAARRNPGADLDWYRSHLHALSQDVALRIDGEPDVHDAAAALAQSLAHTYGYAGDQEQYDDLQNADLLRVIDRRRGLPVTLGILYIAVARAQGWRAYGLGFPGHFLIGLEVAGERLILDPFHGATPRGPAALRTLIKGVLGPEKELEPAHYAPIPDMRVLLRLADNLRVRLSEAGHSGEALGVIGDMLTLAPGTPRLLREQVVLAVQTGRYGQAVETLTALVADPGLDPRARQDAVSLLQKVRTQLN